MSGFLEAISKVLGPHEQVQYGDSPTLAFQIQSGGFTRRVIFEDPIPGAVKELPADKCIEILEPLFSGIQDWPKQNPIVVRMFNEYPDDGGTRTYEITCFLNGVEENQIGNVVAITDPEPLAPTKPSTN